MKHQAIIVLSTKIPKEGTITEDLKLRLDKAIELFFSNSANYLILSGKWDNPNEKSLITHAEAIKKYCISNGIKEEFIIKEENSLDTVGQAFFIKKDLLKPKNWNEIIIISSDYHIERVKTVFNFILGKDYQINYISVETHLSKSEEIIKEEKNRLKVFLDFFKGINKGDDINIEKQLFLKHPYYKKIE